VLASSDLNEILQVNGRRRGQRPSVTDGSAADHKPIPASSKKRAADALSLGRPAGETKWPPATGEQNSRRAFDQLVPGPVSLQRPPRRRTISARANIEIPAAQAARIQTGSGATTPRSEKKRGSTYWRRLAIFNQRRRNVNLSPTMARAQPLQRLFIRRRRTLRRPWPATASR